MTGSRSSRCCPYTGSQAYFKVTVERHSLWYLTKEAYLSQTGRATLSVFENFAAT